MNYIVYMLRCADGTFYAGMTSDLPKRMLDHESGTLPNSYTYTRRPVHLVWSQEFPTHDDAISFERQIKGWSRAKKKALINDDWELIQKIVRDERKCRENKKKRI